jgi:hypothetical protein
MNRLEEFERLLKEARPNVRPKAKARRQQQRQQQRAKPGVVQPGAKLTTQQPKPANPPPTQTGVQKAKSRIKMKDGKIIVPDDVYSMEGVTASDIAAAKRQLRTRALRKQRALGTAARRRSLKKFHVDLIEYFDPRTYSGLARRGIAVMAGVGLLYTMLTGRQPQANTEEAKTISKGVSSQASPTPMAKSIYDDIIAMHKVVSSIQSPEAQRLAGVLQASGQSISTLLSMQLDLDRQGSVQGFSAALQNAEGGLQNLYDSFQALTQLVQTHSPDSMPVLSRLNVSMLDFFFDLEDIREGVS